MKNNEPSLLGKNIIRYRKQKGLSQGDLAARSGLTRRIIGHYETQATEPSIEKIEAIAKALGIPMSKLLEHPQESKERSLGDLSDIDPRSVKKLRDILSLSPEDRNVLYRMLNELLRKNKLEREHAFPKEPEMSTK